MCSKLESVERMADNLTLPVITDLIRMKASSPKALVPISASSFLVDTGYNWTNPSAQHSFKWHIRMGMCFCFTVVRGKVRP